MRTALASKGATRRLKSTTDVADRETTHVEHVCGLVRSIIGHSAGPDVAYAGFLLGLRRGRIEISIPDGQSDKPHFDCR